MRSLRVLVHGEADEGSLAWFFARAFRQLGHQAELFDATRHGSHISRIIRVRYAFPGPRAVAVARANRRFEAYVRRVRPDLLLVMKGMYLFPAAIRAARLACGHVVSFFPDGVTELQQPGILESLAEYERFFTKEPYLVRRLLAAGFNNVSYLPKGCDPLVHRSVALTAEDRVRYEADVSLVGSAYPYRLALLGTLPLSEFCLRIWGAGWQHAPAPLARAFCGAEAVGAAMACVFNASRINLNTAHLQDVFGVNQRTFEIAGCGGFQLVPEQADLPNLFMPGQEVATYRDPADLAGKIRYYLAHGEERAAIAEAGQKRAYRDHTYTQRIAEMISELKL